MPLNLADLRERWAMLGRRRQTATIVAVTAILLAVIWFLT